VTRGGGKKKKKRRKKKKEEKKKGGGTPEPPGGVRAARQRDVAACFLDCLLTSIDEVSKGRRKGRKEKRKRGRGEEKKRKQKVRGGGSVADPNHFIFRIIAAHPKGIPREGKEKKKRREGGRGGGKGGNGPRPLPASRG